MFKWLALACLCACVLGDVDVKQVYNAPLDCEHHVKITSKKNPESWTEYYVVGSTFNWFTPSFAKILKPDGSYKILRCDERNENDKCYVKYFDADETCVDDYEDTDYSRMDYYTTEYSYIGEPESVTCPDGSSGCMQYCQDDKKEYCVIVDTESHFVEVFNHIFTFYNDTVSMDIFALDKCNSSLPNPHLSAPTSTCAPVSLIKPAPLDCAYHVKVDAVESRWRDNVITTEYYGVAIDSKVFALKHIKDGVTTIFRCDDLDAPDVCFEKVFDDETCINDTVSVEDLNDYLPPTVDGFGYESVHFPKSADCPDGSSGCQKYCKDIFEDECVIVDAAGHFVQTKNGDIWTFYEAPSMSVFEMETCGDGEEPKTTIPAPMDFCAPFATLVPKFPNCSFHIKSVGGKSPIRRSVITRRDDPEVEVDFYLVYADGKPLMFKMSSGPFYYLVRFDIANSGTCYMKWSTPQTSCQEEYESIPNMIYEVEEILPQELHYNASEYPVDAPCPDGSDGCKQYCNGESQCVIVNTDGYIVKTVDGAVLTYMDDVTMDVFRTDKCDNVALPPPINPCVASESSSTPSLSSSANEGSSTTSETSSTTSKTSSTTSKTSSATSSTSASTSSHSANVSSASIVECAFTFIAVTLVAALL